MEALQQDKDTITEPRAHGESDLADDGHESEAQGTGTGQAVSHSASFSARSTELHIGDIQTILTDPPPGCPAKIRIPAHPPASRSSDCPWISPMYHYQIP